MPGKYYDDADIDKHVISKMNLLFQEKAKNFDARFVLCSRIHELFKNASDPEIVASIKAYVNMTGRNISVNNG